MGILSRLRELPLPPVVQESLKLARIGLPETDEPGKDAEGPGFEMVLDHFDFLVHGLRAQAEESKEFRQGLVAHFDVAGDSAALGSESKAAVFFVIDESAGGERADHVGHGRTAEAQRYRHVGHTGITLLVNQLLDPLEMVLG